MALQLSGPPARALMRRVVLLGVVLALPIFSHPQAPGISPDWRGLSKASDEVLVVFVKTESRVIDPAKVRRNAVAQQSHDTSPKEIPLQLPIEYTLGRAYTAEVLEVLKSESGVRRGQIIFVYVPSGAYIEGQPLILEHEKYILFLAPLNKKEKRILTQAEFHPRPKDSSGVGNGFDSKFAFGVVGDSVGATTLKGHEDLVAKIKGLGGKDQTHATTH